MSYMLKVATARMRESILAALTRKPPLPHTLMPPMRSRSTSSSVMARRVEALRQAGTHVEFRPYMGLGHGFGPRVGNPAEGWIADAVQFWEASVTHGDD